MSQGSQPPSVVVHVHGGSYPQNGQVVPMPSTSQVASDLAASAPVFDPYQVAKEFPERWADYIRTHFSSPLHVQQRFNVSERTAYRWWKGEGGVNGSHVAVAVREHPVEAPLMLFAAE